jgi:hypothetical protein
VSGVWKDIWASLKSVVGLPATVVALGLALLGFLWNPSFQVSFSLISLAVMTFVVVIIIATAVKLATDARGDARGELPRAVSAFPRAVSAYSPPAADGSTEEPITLIVGRSRQFGVNFLVTVYYEERLEAGRGEIFERAIGIGRGINVQESGMRTVLSCGDASGNAMPRPYLASSLSRRLTSTPPE